MAATHVTIEVTILDKTYRFACSPEEEQALMESARFLDQKMREIRSGGKVFGAERIAVMAALNITHEMLSTRVSDEAAEILQSVDQKVSQALGDKTP